MAGTFEQRVRRAMRGALAGTDSRLVVDATRRVCGEEGTVVMVSYHIEGARATPARFTFPFDERRSVEESLAALLDYGKRSWAQAATPPPISDSSRTVSA